MQFQPVYSLQNQHTTLDGHYTFNLDALPVNYLWQKANAKILKRDSDPVISAAMLLSESSDYRDQHHVLTAGNLRALAFFAPQTTERLANSATQLVMDSTYRTNGLSDRLFPIIILLFLIPSLYIWPPFLDPVSTRVIARIWRSL